MATVNTSVTATWTKLAADTDLDFLISWNVPVSAEFATTATDVAPTVLGHRLSMGDALTREVLGTGFVWARLVDGSKPATVKMIVTK